MTINVLPDNALLEIFDFYVKEAWMVAEPWRNLVHVCSKWRNVVFGSPRRLDLQLFCVPSTPVRETLDVWPSLPIAVNLYNMEAWGMDNIHAALEHPDRICSLTLLNISSSQFQKVLEVTQQSFPTLTSLQLRPKGDGATVVPDSFLGGSAPLLHSLSLDRIPFPGLPNLLLTASRIVYLSLERIPDSAYISPETMVNCLSVMTTLHNLTITFESPRSRPEPESRRPHSRTRTLLPSINGFWFIGADEYLEDLLARIDAPLLYKLSITFFNNEILNTPQLTHFIGRTPKFRMQDEAHVVFSDSEVSVTLPKIACGMLEFKLGISDELLDRQLSFLARVCNSTFPEAFIPTVEHLYIETGHRVPHWQDRDDIENFQWLGLFRPFTAVKHLYISRYSTPRVTPALHELVRERAMEVLPDLQILYLEELPVPKPIGRFIEQFIDARQLAGHPVAVSPWEKQMDEWATIN
jgi:hypothetical protein